MAAVTDKNQFIRDEFECFVRIGLDQSLRSRIRKLIEYRVITGHLFTLMPAIYFETRDSSGELLEMWQLEADSNQWLRLLEFLRRFTIDDVRLIHNMLHREIA